MIASLVALFTVLVASQYNTPIDARDLQLANHYRTVAELYAQHEFDRSITTLAAWKKTDIETAVGRLHSNLLTGGRWTPRLTRIAVMLHTELAMRLFEGDSGSADGQWHLRMAERVLRFQISMLTTRFGAHGTSRLQRRTTRCSMASQRGNCSKTPALCFHAIPRSCLSAARPKGGSRISRRPNGCR